MNRILIALVIMSVGCTTTQKEEPTISLEGNVSAILADGMDHVMVTAEFDKRLSQYEEVVITTNAGHLVTLPSEDFSSGSKKLTVHPESKTYSFLLVSSKFPQEEVVVGIAINKLYSEISLSFDRVCPDELLMDLDDNQLILSTGERSTATLTLLNQSGSLSDSTRIELSVSPDSLGAVEPRVFYSGSSKTVQFVPSGAMGTATLTASIKQGDCEALSSSKKIEITE